MTLFIGSSGSFTSSSSPFSGSTLETSVLNWGAVVSAAYCSAAPTEKDPTKKRLKTPMGMMRSPALILNPSLLKHFIMNSIIRTFAPFTNIAFILISVLGNPR